MPFRNWHDLRAPPTPKDGAFFALVSLDCLNEKEIKQLTTRELFAYFKVIDKVGSRANVRRIVERAR